MENTHTHTHTNIPSWDLHGRYLCPRISLDVVPLCRVKNGLAAVASDGIDGVEALASDGILHLINCSHTQVHPSREHARHRGPPEKEREGGRERVREVGWEGGRE